MYTTQHACFPVNSFSFSTVLTFDILSDDYSKLVFLHCNRYVEFHSQHGHYYKTRIPKFGRDFSYHYPSCDLYFVGARENNVCDINPVHYLFATGTAEGKVECWDPRTRGRVGLLDCALSSVTQDTEVEGLPSVSALKFNGALHMAVGTSTGQILMYDLRSNRPLLVKDHHYGLPIKSIHFQDQLDLVLSADSKIIKMWNKDTKEEEEPEGKPSDAESSESSDNDKGWVEEVRKQRKLMYFEERAKRQERKEKAREDRRTSLEPKFFEIKAGEEFRSFKDTARKQKLQKTTLEDRLKFEEKSGTLNVSDATVGSKQLTFKLKKCLDWNLTRFAWFLGFPSQPRYISQMDQL
ncbi:UNVERIFIED_CONTAM: hypothetical protein FKN15_035057 [Acipenser sinensis]